MGKIVNSLRNIITKIGFYISGFNKEKTEYLLNEADTTRKNILFTAFQRGLSISQISFIRDTNRAWTNEDIGNIVLCYYAGMTTEQIKSCYTSWASREQIKEAINGYSAKLSKSEVTFYYQEENSPYLMHILRYALLQKVTIENLTLLVYSQKTLSEEQIYEGVKGLIEGLEIEKVLYYCRKGFNVEQMQQGRKGFENGLKQTQIAIYYKESYNAKQMRKMRKKLKEQNLNVALSSTL